MLGGMIERVFLGWDRPFLTRAVPWLLERRDALPGLLVVVPTAQSGRRLREALAETGGSVLSPRVVTPGSFLQSRDEEAAPDWTEQVAWVEVLEDVTDWADYVDLFPEQPGEGRDWAGGLAREMVRLRHALQENGLLLNTAARWLGGSVEAGRWEALGRLETQVERKLQSWGLKSRSRLLAEGLRLPAGVTGIVLAGVTEIPPLAEKAILSWDLPVTVLIGAPEKEEEAFSPLGRPVREWSERVLPEPNGSLQVVADPRQQASEALKCVAEAGTHSDDVVVGTADTETGDELARTFTRAGWTAFHPAAAQITGGLVRWFKVWNQWLADPALSVMADLLALPETGVLVSGLRAQKARTLADLRDRWMINRPEDLYRRVAAENFRKEKEQEAAESLCKAAESLESWRTSCLGAGFAPALDRLLAVLSNTSPATRETAEQLSEWFGGTGWLMERVRRGPSFWIELMLSAAPPPPPLPPEGRVLDVQGWLELFHESGNHLILCGMNEGKVPGRIGGEPWLGEASRGMLGLITDQDRAARDAYLYQALLEARKEAGRVDVLCGKSGSGGEALLPSRVLLATSRELLPGRVKQLFREVEPPEAGLRWSADWQWQPRATEPPQRLSVTSLRDWLACPFRYYLKHAVHMQEPEAGRAEWNARDFGNVAHDVLERWGLDTEARDSARPEEIHGWLSAELDRVVAGWFGKRIPLAVRIQTEALRQRFLWLARVQAAAREEGWEVVDVERKIELPVGEAKIIAKIDRIDRHRETGRLRVLDYKTGKVDSVDKAHRKRTTPSSVLPAHLTKDCPAIYTGEDAKGKTTDYQWLNLQLPLYAAALVERGDPLPSPCYITLSTTEAEVGLHEWKDFDTADLEAARLCADWIAAQIAGSVFWPPAEKVTYDDYEILAAGRSLQEMMLEPRFPDR